MKERYLKAVSSITWQSRQFYRRCANGGIFGNRRLQIQPIGKTVQSEKKISIRWEKPKRWPVPIRAAHELEAAGL